MALRTPVVIVESRFGRFGNLMLTGAHVAAFTLEHGFELFLLPLCFCAPFLENLHANPLCQLPPRRGLVLPSQAREMLLHGCRKTRRLLELVGLNRICAVYDIGWDQSCSLQDPRVAAEIRDKGLAIFSGYHFRAWDLVKKHQDQLRSWFAFRSEASQSAKAIAEGLRSKGDVLVGVHCRGGDYAQNFGGRFFFSAAQYLSIVNRMQKILAPRRPVFIISTNDPAYRELSKHDSLVLAPGDLGEDQCLLARADYIVGPPSTFSLWPAFIGHVPLLHLQSVNQTFSLEDFHPPETLHYWLDRLTPDVS